MLCPKLLTKQMHEVACMVPLRTIKALVGAAKHYCCWLDDPHTCVDSGYVLLLPLQWIINCGLHDECTGRPIDNIDSRICIYPERRGARWGYTKSSSRS